MTTSTLTRTDTLLLGPATLSAVGPADPLVPMERESYDDHCGHREAHDHEQGNRPGWCDLRQ